jgi:alpha-ketoglutarate-dependent taurine dioxygenase
MTTRRELDLCTRPHQPPATVTWNADGSWPVPTTGLSLDDLVEPAGRAARAMPTAVHDALVAFADHPHRSGALLVQGAPIGSFGTTPPSPTAVGPKDATSEFTLLAIARRLGQPVGYLPEHGGDIVQNIVPVAGTADRQVSTSSKVTLMFHTEAAFHPHRPRYLVLLCLRGDPAAHTTLSSIHEVLPLLPHDVVDTLFAPRFRTAVDESYLHGRQNVLGEAMAVLSGNRARPTMVFDADLMVGVDTEADEALQVLGAAVAAHSTSVALTPGDVLVVDNTVAVHGRTPFVPRFDGTDRWLQRSFVVADLAPSAGERRGRTIVTEFGI